MKKYLLITLLCLATIAQAQTTKPIEGFLGIKFGSSKAQVIQALKAKGGVQDVNYKEEGVIVFGFLKLAGREADAFFVGFFKDQAYQAAFVSSRRQTPK